ncbi:MAG: prepilin peptidase [Actinobacteria bacterium]|uniref:Unannotated protein n=1 Tax=freshwater metagenome TaxID=449393 RepID=A0A6J7IP05_9ZZZZ|nr:prepilin peptidase [Actinomycetota bacterium]
MTDPLDGFLIVGLGVLGVIVGSFLNVVIARVPAGASIVRPRSSCPGCGTFIESRDNIPLLSWLVLRGRCRTCHEPISARYPLVEGLTGILWAIIGLWSLGQPGTWISPLLPTLLVVVSAGIALLFIDLDCTRLPDAIVLPLWPVTIAGLVLAGVVSGDWPLARALAGAALWLVVIGGIWLATGGRGMGLGDVKLAPLLGLVLGWIGWGPASVGLATAWLVGGATAVILLVAGRAGRRQAIPFGPFLLIGFLIGVLAGSALLDAYLRGTGLANLSVG